MLTDAATRSKRDELRSLKENVIMGHLISAGTGMTKYKTLAVEDPDVEDDQILEALEQLESLASMPLDEMELESEAETAAD